METEEVERSPEIYRGHLDECLEDLSGRLNRRHPKGSHRADQDRQKIAKFCGIASSSVLRWLNGGVEPQAAVRIKLMCYLDMVGFRVIELEEMKESRRKFLDLIGFGIITLAQATQELGYTNPSTLSKVLQGNTNCNEAKKTQMFDIWLAHRDTLAERKRAAMEESGINLAETSLVRRRAASSRKGPSLSGVDGRAKAIILIAQGLETLLSAPLNAADLAALVEASEELSRLNARLGELGFELLRRPTPEGKVADKK